MSLSNKIPLILLLLFFPFLTNCTENRPDSIGSVTELDVILDSSINLFTVDQIESSIVKFRVQGFNEPFFERVSFQGTVQGKIPRSKNLLLILESGSPLFNSTFAELFDPQFLKSVASSDNPITLVKNDLFYQGQKVYIILISGNKPDPKKYLNTLSQLVDKMVQSSIRSIRQEQVENYNEELSQTLFDSLGISIRIPVGFELTPMKNNNSSFLIRRGVGTKTEEWITISPLTDSLESPKNEIEFRQQRTNMLSQLIQFTDGSTMETPSAVMIDTDGLRFRGEWITKPYPMSGFYSGKLVESRKGLFYIEAGIYSPGRSKTLNLLRLENFLNYDR
ncbi:MAG: DUF4837 family protein [Ignavibacteriales bacterium]|nr:DUF4837 family protein [Ignavibacteriales bacterium]